MNRMFTITVTETVGQCRWCRCTDRDPCENTCGWANRQQTLCTECVEFDRVVRTAGGRRALVEAWRVCQDAQAASGQALVDLLAAGRTALHTRGQRAKRR